MMKFKLAIFLVANLIRLAAVDATNGCHIVPPYTSHSIVSLYSQDKVHLAAVHNVLRQYCQVRTFSGDPAQVGEVNSFIVTHEQARALQESKSELGEVVVEADNVAKFIEKLPQQKSGYTQRVMSDLSFSSLRISINTTFYNSYHVYEDLRARWRELVANNPQFVRAEVVGKTWEGRDIEAMRIGNTSATNPKRVLFNGMQHAREWVSPMVPLYVAEKLVENLASGKGFVAKGLAEVEFIIIPVVNPDGYIYTHTTDRFWRKNRRNDTGCPQGGVDLNRNWPVEFGGPETTSGDPCSEVYYGTAALSEPETSAIEKYIKGIGKISVHIDFHSYGQYIFGGWLYTLTDAPNQYRRDRLGNAYRKAVRAATGFEYAYGKAGKLLYLVSGCMSDWMSSLGTLGFTVELRPGSTASGLQGFVLAEREILPTCVENWRGTKALLSYVLSRSFPSL